MDSDLLWVRIEGAELLNLRPVYYGPRSLSQEQLAGRRATSSGNASLIANFSSCVFSLVCYELVYQCKSIASKILLL